MKTSENQPTSGKLITGIILAIVAAGTVSLSVMADIDKGSGINAFLFIAFLGAIIAVQIIPGMMLFGMMVKGVAKLFSKEEAAKRSL